MRHSSLALTAALAFAGVSAASVPVPAHDANVRSFATSPNDLSIAQMTDNTPVAGSGVACHDNSITFDTSWWRRFYFAEHGAPASVSIRGVTVAAERSLPTWLTLHLYSIPHAVPVDTIAIAQLTWIGSGSALTDGRDLQSLSIPASARIEDSVANDLVVEYRIDGSPGWLFAGANGSAETHPSFISSAGCRVAEPTPVADLQLPDAHLVMVVDTGPGAPSLSKAFAPSRIDLGAASRLTITLGNLSQSEPAVLSTDLADAFPAGLVTASTPNASTTCPDGRVTTTRESVTLTAGSRIPAAGQCTVSVDVTSAAGGVYANSIAAGRLITQLGSNTAAAKATLTIVPPGGGNGIASSGYYSIFSNSAIPAAIPGQSINMTTFAFRDDFFGFDHQTDDWDFEFIGGFFVLDKLVFDSYERHHSRFAVDGNGKALLLQEGDVVGPNLTFASNAFVQAPAFHAGVDGYAGVRFDCDGRLTFPVPDTVCYGYIHLRTSAPNGFPASIVDAAFDGDGRPMTISRVLPADPVVSIDPVSLDLTAPADGAATATLTLRNAGGRTPLTYMMHLNGSGGRATAALPAATAPNGMQRIGPANAIAAAIDAAAAGSDWMAHLTDMDDKGGPCFNVGTTGWLMASPDYASVQSGSSADVLVIADPGAQGLSEGTYTTELCVWTNDGTQPLIVVPTTLTVTAPAGLPCSALDTLFCDGFDRLRGDGTTQVYESRGAFLAAVAPGFHENPFDNLHPSGASFEPALHYIDPPTGLAYTIDSLPFANHLSFGEGVVRIAHPRGRLVVTFTGSPVTAVGGNFYSATSDAIPFIGEWVVLKLDDGTIEMHRTTGSEDFRGFTSTVPITSITIDAPKPLHWSTPALDNLIIGTAR